MVSSGASDRIYVLAWDYRGFGKSSGTPIEDAMIKDTVDVLSWAMDTAKLSPDRIVLLAQSLGTALATAAASYFIHLEPPIEFGGMILCAGFTDTATVFMSYSPGGLVPLLAPLRLSSSSRTWFSRQLKDMWRNADRLADLVKASRKIRLVLFHATSDKVIPWSQSDALAYAAVNAASEGVTSQEFEATKQPIQLDEGGWINTWTFGDKTIQQRIVKHGGELAEQVIKCVLTFRRAQRYHEMGTSFNGRFGNIWILINLMDRATAATSVAAILSTSRSESILLDFSAEQEKPE